MVSISFVSLEHWVFEEFVTAISEKICQHNNPTHCQLPSKDWMGREVLVSIIILLLWRKWLVTSPKSQLQATHTRLRMFHLEVENSGPTMYMQQYNINVIKSCYLFLTTLVCCLICRNATYIRNMLKTY